MLRGCPKHLTITLAEGSQLWNVPAWYDRSAGQ